MEYSTANEGCIHRTIKKVSQDIEAMKFNTAIAALMAMVNDFYANGCSKGDYKALLLLLSPFAPHMVEELWENVGFGGGFACQQKWPAYEEAKCRENTVEIAVQVNGKVRARITIGADLSKEEVIAAAKADEKIASEISGKTIVKEICVPGKLVNIVAK